MSMSEKRSDGAIARGLDHWWTSLGREFGPLSRPQRRTLHTLADREVAGQVTRVGDIAAQLQLTAAGATRMLDTLEALGYATRYRSPTEDQRQVYVALTLVGRAALDQSDRAFYERVAASLAPLTGAERQTLATLLGRLTTTDASHTDSPSPEADDKAPTEA
jgi:DNA-binding MarR family transcriptional regulator